MPGRTKVACVMDMLDRSRPSACGYLRLLLPLTKPVVAAAVDVRFIHAEDVPHTRADVVIVQRTAVATAEAADRLVGHVAATRARLIYEIDDDLLALGEGHPDHAHYAPARPVVERLAAEADEMWVSTPALAARFGPIARAVHVFRNELDSRVWRAPSPAATGDVVRFLFMGTISHAGDFDRLLRPAFARLRAAHGARVSLTLVGVTPDEVNDPGVTSIAPPGEIAASYPAFAAWLQRQGPFDIGLAPLGDTPFTRGKSEIKALEYAALGLPTLATAAGAYPDWFDGDGLAVAPGADALHDAMARLTGDVAARAAMRDRAAARATAMLAASVAEARLGHLLKNSPRHVASMPVVSTVS